MRAPQDDQGFVPIQGAPAAVQESIPAASLVGAAYGFIWLAVLVFLWLLFRRSAKTERELAELRRRIAAVGGGSSGESSQGPS
jgi:CcmD family protein